MNIHLSEAKLCANCDTVHEDETCPVCTSSNSLDLHRILNRSNNNEKVRKNLEKNVRIPTVTGLRPIVRG